MSYYKYYITLEKDGYHFGLYPNNNNNQWVVISNVYPTYEQAKKAMEIFQNIVVVQKEKAFTIQKLAVGKYELSFTHENIEVKYILGNAHLCKKKMERVIKNINAPLRIKEV